MLRIFLLLTVGLLISNCSMNRSQTGAVLGSTFGGRGAIYGGLGGLIGGLL